MNHQQQSLTQKWLRQNTAPYPHKDRVYADIDAALARFPTLGPKFDVYTHDDGRTQLLLCVHGLLPISFRQVSYNIPIAIWITKEYPSQPPIVYVVPTSDMLVKAGKHVDVSGRINIEYTQLWGRKSEGCHLSALLDAMQDQFSRECPVYAKPKTTVHASDQQTSRISPQGYAAKPPPPLPTQSTSSPQQKQTVVAPLVAGDRPSLPVKPGAITQIDSRFPPSSQPSQTFVNQPLASSSSLVGPSDTKSPTLPQSQYLTGIASPLRPPTWPPRDTAPPLAPTHSWSPSHANHPPPLVRPALPVLPTQLSGNDSSRDASLHVPKPPLEHRAPPNLLDEDCLEPPPQQPAAPPRPANPELLQLQQHVQEKFAAEFASFSQAMALDGERLRAQQADLLAGEPAIRDEMARLEAVKDVCRSVAGRIQASIDHAERDMAELRRKGDPEVDELVCSTSIVHNQLIELVAEDKGIEDTIYHLHRALNAGRIDLERFLRTTRVLAEEQFMKRALIEKIQEGLPIGASMAY